MYCGTFSGKADPYSRAPRSPRGKNMTQNHSSSQLSQTALNDDSPTAEVRPKTQILTRAKTQMLAHAETQLLTHAKTQLLTHAKTHLLDHAKSQIVAHVKSQILAHAKT